MGRSGIGRKDGAHGAISLEYETVPFPHLASLHNIV